MFPTLRTIRRLCTAVDYTSVADALQQKASHQPIKILGWVKKQRKYKQISFLDIDDGSTLQRIQVIVPKKDCPKNLTYHACIIIEGKLVPSQGDQQKVEMVADRLKVLSPGAPIEFPFVEKGVYLKEDLRQVPHLRPRVRDFAALIRVRSEGKMVIHDYFDKEGFINIDTPILTPNNCEGGSEAFAVKGGGEVKPHNTDIELGDELFGRPVFLSVSGQLYLEAMAAGMGKVYNFNPAFRCEGSSRLHLHEFWMVEMEEAFLEGRHGQDSLMERMEKFVKSTVRDLMSRSDEDIRFLWKFNQKEDPMKDLIPKLLEKPFVRLRFNDALKILEENEAELKTPLPRDGVGDLNREAELFLTKYHDNIPVFITDFPAATKPFYMYTYQEEDKEWACGVDLLFPFVGEVAGGGVREHRLDVLQEKVASLRTKEDLKWYIELREFGYPSSAGFGMGFERLIQFLLGIDNIKDTIPFPRTSGHYYC